MGIPPPSGAEYPKVEAEDSVHGDTQDSNLPAIAVRFAGFFADFFHVACVPINPHSADS